VNPYGVEILIAALIGMVIGVALSIGVILAASYTERRDRHLDDPD